MNTHMRKSLPCYVFVLSVFGLLLIPSLNDTAHAQCVVEICKSAPELPEPQSEDDLVFFPFTASKGEETDSFDVAANSKCSIGGFSELGIEIVEDFFPGWILSDVECSDAVGVNVTLIENGLLSTVSKPAK